MSIESRISKLEAIAGTITSQEGDGPDTGDFIHVLGMIETFGDDDDLIAPGDATPEVVEALAAERHRRRIARGESVGIPVDQLPHELAAVLSDWPATIREKATAID